MWEHGPTPATQEALMTERGEELLALWNELDGLTDQKDSVGVSAVLTVLAVTLVLLGLDGGSISLLLWALLPGAVAAMLIGRDLRRNLRKREIRKQIEASPNGSARRIGTTNTPSKSPEDPTPGPP